MKGILRFALLLALLPISCWRVTAQALQPQWVRQADLPLVNTASTLESDLEGNLHALSVFTAPAMVSQVLIPSAGLYMLKFDPDGNCLRAHPHPAMPGGSPMLRKIDPFGNYYFVGTFDHQVTIGGTTLQKQGAEDLFIAKMNGQSGQIEWAMRAGGNGIIEPYSYVNRPQDQPFGISFDAAGNCYLAAELTKNFTYGSSSQVYITSGFKGLMKITPQGNLSWISNLYGLPHDESVSIQLAASPFGYTYVHIEGRLHKYGRGGNLLWTRNITPYAVNSGGMFTGQLEMRTEDRLYIGDRLSAYYAMFGPDSSTVQPPTPFGVSVAAIDSSGLPIWGNKVFTPFPTAGMERPTNLVVLADNSIAINVRFKHQLLAGSYNLASNGDLDHALLRYSATGALQDAARYGTGGTNELQTAITGGPGQSIYLTAVYDTTFSIGNDTFSGLQKGRFFALLGNSVVAASSLLSGPDVKMYPNPTTNILHLQLERPVGIVPATVEVTDATGRVLYRASFSGGSCMVTTGNWPTGLYFARIQTGQGIAVKKVIKH